MRILALVFLAAAAVHGQNPRAAKPAAIPATPAPVKKTSTVPASAVRTSRSSIAIPYNLVATLRTKGQAHDKKMKMEPVLSGKAQPARNGRVVPAVPAVPTHGKVTTVAAATLSTPPMPVPIADGQLRSVPLGTTRADVLQKLGEPHMKITSDMEYYTYMLASGNSAQLELEAGKLTHVQVVRSK